MPVPGLPGCPICPIGVALLLALVLLDLAWHAARMREAELEAILPLAESEGAQVPDNARWRTVVEAARRGIGSLL